MGRRNPPVMGRPQRPWEMAWGRGGGGGGGWISRAPRDESRGAKDSISPAAAEEIPVDKSDVIGSNDPVATPWAGSHDPAENTQPTPGQEDHPPAPTSANTGESGPAQGKSPGDNPYSMHPSDTASSAPQDADGRWKAAPPNEDDPQTSSFANTQDEGLRRAIKRADLGTGYVRPPARPGHESHSSAAMFTNAHINELKGGTFHVNNVAHIYECDSPAQGGRPGLQIAVLGLQAVSLATHYSHCNYPLQLEVAPPSIMASTSTVYVTLQFPSLYREMKIMMTPLTLWFFIKVWMQRRAVEHH